MICEKCGKELNENEVCSCEEVEVVNVTVEDLTDEPNNWQVILSAIIYPVIVTGLGIFLYVNMMTGILNLVVSILLSIGFVTCMLIGGFYFLIVPLPYIFFYEFGGVNKPSLALWKKILLGVGAVASIILSVLVYFIV